MNTLIPILLADVTISTRGLADPGEYPGNFAGWVGAGFLLLQFVWRMWGDKFPNIVKNFLNRVPLFKREFVQPVVPVINDSIDSLWPSIKPFIDELLRRNVPQNTITTMVSDLLDKLLPELNKAQSPEAQVALAKSAVEQYCAGRQ